MNLKHMLHSILLFCFILNINFAVAGDAFKCKQLLLNEFKTVLSKDEGLIHAQLSLTASKLAQKVWKRRGLPSQTLEAYTQSIIGNKTISRVNNSTKIQNEILDTYSKYSGSKKYLNATGDLEALAATEKMTDKDVSRLMIQLEQSWKNFGFNENDYAMAWFVNTASKNATGKDSTLISDFVKELLSSDNVDKKIAQSLKEAQLNLKAELTKLKAKVFEKHKDICLNLYNEDNINAQNTSIFENAACKIEENAIINSIFKQSIEDLLSKSEVGNSINPLAIIEDKKEINSSDKAKIQDKINSLTNDKQKIIDYYKSGLSKSTCDGFLIVDKKNKTTSLYLNNGDEVMTSKSIIGTGKMNEYKEFNPDSILRKWKVRNADGSFQMKKSGKHVFKYTRTTGAGTFYMDKTLPPEEREKRQYGKEFNDRVMVMYSKKKNGKREEVQAIHGVPNIGWIENKDSRMNSFDDDKASRELSTGCVNLEGYTYDIMNEFIGNDCPMYILPEDSENYYYVKNGELKFSTDSKLRLTGKEKLTMILSDGEKTKDPKNYNLYNFTPRNKKNYIKSYSLKNEDTSDVITKLIKEKETLYRRAVIIENDDFEDLVELTYSITNNESKAVDTFIDLYNSFYRSSLKNRTSRESKKKEILKRYKKDFDPNVDTKDVLNKSKEVTFYYD